MSTLVREFEKTYLNSSHREDIEEQISIVEKQVADAKTEFFDEI